jgi:hypothetical protein
MRLGSYRELEDKLKAGGAQQPCKVPQGQSRRWEESKAQLLKRRMLMGIKLAAAGCVSSYTKLLPQTLWLDFPRFLRRRLHRTPDSTDSMVHIRY